VKPKGMEGLEVSISSGHRSPLCCRARIQELPSRLSSLAKPRVKESSMRVKKRVKRGVKKGIKRVKSAPPEAYLAGSSMLVGGAAVLLLATTKKGQELLIRTAQLALRPVVDEQESQQADVPGKDDEQESQDSSVQKDVHDEPGEDAEVEEEPEEDAEVEEEPEEDAEVEEEPEEDAEVEEESKVTDLKPRHQRPRSAAPGRRPSSSRKAPAPAED
jgi:hypothetical protein